MEDESSSWVARAKFSPTVYHRSASSKFSSMSYGYKSGWCLDLEENGLIGESKRRGPGPVSEAKKKEPCLDSPSICSGKKTDRGSESKFMDSITDSFDSFSFNSYLGNGGSQFSSNLPDDSDSTTVDFSFHSDLVTASNPMKDSIHLPSDTYSLKSSQQHAHTQSLSPVLTELNSQTIAFSFNPDLSTSTILPLNDSNRVSSDSVSLLPESVSLHHRCRTVESNSQHVDFSFYSDVCFDSNSKKLGSCASCFTSLNKEPGPRLHNSCLFPDQKERKSKPKQRAVSPLPNSVLSDVFKEAKRLSKRFSTPPPHRDEPDITESEPLRQVSYGKGCYKSTAKKETRRVTAVETTEKWMVDLSQLYFGARFASGAYSRLYYGKYKNQPVAVKIIRFPDNDETGVMAARLEKHFTRETAFLSHLCHRNVIKLAGACEKHPIFFIITEYLSGGSLRTFLLKQDRNPLPLDKLVSISLDVSRGMEYIHSQGVIHRDLKPENILFDHNFCVKIADFGVACKEADCDVLEDDAGTYRWMAPEMIKHKPYGRKVDVYSFGLLLWEMISGTIPYEDMTPVQAAFAVVNKNIRPVIPAGCPVVLQILIEQCWSTVAEKRPEFWQIVKILEQFESDLACGGPLVQLQSLTFRDYKKRFLTWVEKLRPPKVDAFKPSSPKTL